MQRHFLRAHSQFSFQSCARFLLLHGSKRAMTTGKPWRFAPLDPSITGSSRSNLEPLHGIVFDVDGTLCEPQNYMFGEMREALGITKSVDILEHIESLAPGAAQDEAQEKVRTIERRAMRLQTPQPGLAEVMAHLERRNVRKGICTRNFDEPIRHLLTTFLPDVVFAPIVTRAFKPPKPDPAGILHIASAWSAPAHSLIMVGDSIDDMSAGARAGAYTILLASEANAHIRNHASTDLCVERLDDLIPILENGALPPFQRENTA